MKRRAILFFLLFLLQMGSVPTLAAEPTVAAQGAALIDGKTGRLLWGKDLSERFNMIFLRQLCRILDHSV